MDMSFEQKVRERAYEIWVAAGMQDGMADEHWCAAEADVKTAPAASAQEMPLGKAAATPRAKAPAKAPAKLVVAKKAAKKAAKPVAKPAARTAKGGSAAHLN